MNPDRALSAYLTLLAAALPFSIALSNILFFPLLGLWILGGIWTFRLWPPRWGALEKWFLVFLGVSIVSAFCGSDPGHSLKELRKDSYFLIYFALAAMITRRESARRLLFVFVGACTAAATLGLIQAALGVNVAEPHGGALISCPGWIAHWPHSVLNYLAMVNGRVRGTLPHPLFFAEILMLGLSISVAFLARSGPFVWPWSVCFWTIGAALIYSQSRGPWIAAAVVIALAVALTRTGKQRLRLLLIALPLTIFFAVPTLQVRLCSIVGLKHESNQERVHMWHAGWELFKEHPLLGVGPGNIKRESLPYANAQERVGGGWGHLHSVYVNFAAERGALGLGAFSVLMAVFAARLLCAVRQAGRDTPDGTLLAGGFLAWVGFLVCGLTETDYNTAQVLMSFYFVMGSAVALAQSLVPVKADARADPARRLA